MHTLRMGLFIFSPQLKNILVTSWTKRYLLTGATVACMLVRVGGLVQPPNMVMEHGIGDAVGLSGQPTRPLKGDKTILMLLKQPKLL